jgi:putative SOS response-associated peptidase YedK
MCVRYIFIQKAGFLEKRFNVKVPASVHLTPSYNIAPGKYAPVITNDKPHEIQLYRFGLISPGASGTNLIINERAEGDCNPEDDPKFIGSKGIISKPAFIKPFRTQRCLIPADAFIVGPEKEKLNKPYVVYLRNKVRPFSFAGIWDQRTNPESGEILSSFAIITTVANILLLKIPYRRSPVILHREDEKKWLSNDLRSSEISTLLVPYPGELMNAYPIAPTIKNPLADDPGLIHPAGGRVMPENDLHSGKKVQTEGFGSYRQYGFDEIHPWSE